MVGAKFTSESLDEEISASSGECEFRYATPLIKRRGVLLVEDDELIVEVVSGIVSSLGLNVATASSTDDAVREFIKVHQRIRAILLDYMLPGMHVGEFLQFVRRTDSKIRVIFVSGYPVKWIKQELSEEVFSLADGFLAKPFRAKNLRDILT